VFLRTKCRPILIKYLPIFKRFTSFQQIYQLSTDLPAFNRFTSFQKIYQPANNREHLVRGGTKIVNQDKPKSTIIQSVVARVARWYAYFHTKNPNSGNLLRAQKWTMLGDVMAIWYIYGQLVYFVVRSYLYNFPILVCCI
jgi:hypothetical protein